MLYAARGGSAGGASSTSCHIAEQQACRTQQGFQPANPGSKPEQVLAQEEPEQTSVPCPFGGLRDRAMAECDSNVHKKMLPQCYTTDLQDYNLQFVKQRAQPGCQRGRVSAPAETGFQAPKPCLDATLGCRETAEFGRHVHRDKPGDDENDAHTQTTVVRHFADNKSITQAKPAAVNHVHAHQVESKGCSQGKPKSQIQPSGNWQPIT